ncbi:antibiotic biosynthesis monooxygenase [Dechloromonas sp. XY25]|uniref:Antibiotic biosynthesis monooxygenase n=1 Tax=Dechloromonas hankyongensis TaxID=2908002 RepID=A0ABS9K1D0_9RHOO|nr:putative quinol monooxygenase [Dechloromonas hankyongensis]MCG2576963.1 antibiotic biosynthesis monooxygenase [Dechloromonas hankyongensis]
MERAMVKIIARISAKPGAAAQVRQILIDLVGPSRKEPGCLSYELFQDDENPADFITIEQWANSSAVAAHMATPHVGEAIAKAGSLLAVAPLIHSFTQLA